MDEEVMLETQKITALIPTHNEAPRLPGVLEAVCKVKWIDKIVVIDSYSQDGTLDVARRFPVEVISLNSDKGKGAALAEGIRREKDSDIYIFLDADLIGLNEEHVLALVRPLIEDPSLAMTIGVFKEGRKLGDLAQKLFPILNGMRGVRGEWVRNLPDFSWTRFGVETFLTRVARETKVSVEFPALSGLAHYHKEEKYGFFLGLYHRIKMYKEIVQTLFLYKKRIENWPKLVGEEERHGVMV
ncbi:MAG TPA: glycosyltransferase family 2 protein [Candidatus Atribacteria bacterium]|nr:glycosyltransferase family 2 protein [Candidatus Atribacteria bacterium]HPU08774.1 glycosyltransferase family 2 protein [Candidatus Atribacteria bacterium]